MIPVIAPFALFTEILIDGRSRAGFLASVLDWPTVVVLARESAIAIVTVTVVALLDALGRERQGAREALALVPDGGEEDAV